MKSKIVVMVCAVLLLATGCGLRKPTLFYQYKDGNPSFDAVKYECQAEAIASAQSVDCRQACTIVEQPQQNIYIGHSTGGVSPLLQELAKPRVASNQHSICDQCQGEKQLAQEAHWVACVSRKGWLPCNQGGQGRPECQQQ